MSPLIGGRVQRDQPWYYIPDSTKLDSAGSINICLCMVGVSGKATARDWGKERVDEVM